MFAQTRDELEKKRKEIQQEIQELQRAQSEISKDKKAGLSQLKLIERKLRSRYAVIENLNDEMKMIDNTIFNDNREIYRLQRELDTLKKQYARTIEYAYKNRSSYDMMNFIFSATSFNDAVRRVNYLKTYRQYRDEQVGNINRTQKELSVKINTLTKDKKDKGKVLLEQNMQKELLESEKKEKNQFVTKLKSREKEIEKEMAAKRKIERSLQSSIAAIVKREIEAARRKAEEDAKKAAAVAVKPVESKPAAASSSAAPVATRKVNVLENTPEVTRVSVGFENNRGNLPWPVEKATVTAGFGRQKIEGTSIIEDNIGLTIQTVPGSNVKAVFDGTVATVYDVAGSQTITIKHGKYFTTYYNLSSVNVSKGSVVKMGQPIGKAAQNDDGDGEIIFVVNVESKFVDPEDWLKNR
ncbi:MAG: peptidoglycan DD-metalloendopeptidase family protein [Chitinophagaceae bacterium]|nr:peptidoglycan DD-metalloendopeptidase family protein [Chitinophagaceae bacterium]MCE2758912.1 peptidoglycan DD-metalloendopeptidase family protein [Chitinophagaceae bacterium]